MKWRRCTKFQIFRSSLFSRSLKVTVSSVSIHCNDPIERFSLFLGQECPGGLPVTFAKVTGKSPRTYSPPVLLYASEPGVAITAECYNRFVSPTHFLNEKILNPCTYKHLPLHAKEWTSLIIKSNYFIDSLIRGICQAVTILYPSPTKGFFHCRPAYSFFGDYIDC